MARYPTLAAATLATCICAAPVLPVLAHPIPPAQAGAQARDESQGDSPSYFRPTYFCLPAFDGTGILEDGDFSAAPDPEHGDGETLGTVFAPDWIVAQRTIDFYGRDDAWPVPHGYCSVDLDGSGPQGVGAIAHTPVATSPGTRYRVEFLFSGNFGCARSQHGPIVKKMRVEAVGKHEDALQSVLF